MSERSPIEIIEASVIGRALREPIQGGKHAYTMTTDEARQVLSYARSLEARVAELEQAMREEYGSG